MIVVLDFDGTITVQDTSDTLFAEFGAFTQLSDDLMSGALTVAEYYSAAFASMANTCPPERLQQWLQQREIDPGFSGLLTWLKAKHIPTRIVSDGFDVYIMPILERLGFADIPVSANSAIWNGSQFIPTYPGATESCTCFCASCKRNAVLRDLADDEVVVFVGDGRSDTCAVQHADVVFAKGFLASWCTAQRIPHHPFKTLADVQRILASSLATKPFRQRRQAVLARKAAYLEE